MFDQITTIEDGLIHHGKNNNRVYVMKAPSENLPLFFDRIEMLAGQQHYEKIVAKVPKSLADAVKQRGYVTEAKIPGFFKGRENCLFMSNFLTEDRQQQLDKKLTDDVLSTANGCVPAAGPDRLADDMLCRRMKPEDAGAMAGLYKEVFASYPFPIYDSSYIEETMQDNVIYFGIWQADQLVALASSELDREDKNAEMTDFAVKPDCRGQNLSSILLLKMEQDLSKNEDIRTLYTIARARSHGMNCTFAKNGYSFGGQLINNTQIAGRIESMNVWYKNV